MSSERKVTLRWSVKEEPGREWKKVTVDAKREDDWIWPGGLDGKIRDEPRNYHFVMEIPV